MNACDLNKKELPSMEEENPWSFDSEKDKKKLNKRNWEGSKRKTKKKWRTKFKFLLFSFLKTIFNRSGGIELGIENVLKTGSTDQKESKEELIQAESFSLKNWIFRSVEKQVRSIESWKIRRFWNPGNFLQKHF